MIVFPSGVSTDSGWNWMPCMSYSRCFSAMICPSGLMAVMASASGKSFVSTTQEWYRPTGILLGKPQKI